MKTCLFLLAMAFVFSACAPAEEAETMVLEFPDRPDADNPVSPNYSWPGSWEYRFDNPSDDLVVTGDSAVAEPDVYFTNMTPGWHATLKSPAGIFWHPSSTAEGDFKAYTNIFLFDPGDMNEGYGLFIGGSDLAGPNQQYLYFLLRRTGEFLIKVRDGEETRDVMSWTANEAVAAWTEESSGTINNNMAIQTEGDTISFMVNDTTVHSMEIGDLPVNGVVGFRLNHMTNVHISAFSVESAGDQSEASMDDTSMNEGGE